MNLLENVSKEVIKDFESLFDMVIEDKFQYFISYVSSEEEIKPAIERQKLSIITSIIYSKESVLTTVDGAPVYCMSGFVERVGRLPVPGDSIRLTSPSTNYLLSVVGNHVDGWEIRSMVNFEIVKLNNK